MLQCRDCGISFDFAIEHKVYGQDGLEEKWSACPRCGSDDLFEPEVIYEGDLYWQKMWWQTID